MGQGQTKLKGVDYLEVESLFQRWKWVRLVRMVNREGAFSWSEQLTVEVRLVGSTVGRRSIGSNGGGTMKKVRTI